MDWQTVTVAVVVLAALVYVARRGWARLRSLRAPGAGGASCTTGCGTCGGEPKPAAAPPQVLVHISRPASVHRPPARRR